MKFLEFGKQMSASKAYTFGTSMERCKWELDAWKFRKISLAQFCDVRKCLEKYSNNGYVLKYR